MDMNHWNISDEILQFALDKDLHQLATGGGCDFIAVIWDDGVVAVLQEVDSGETPERLDDCGVPVVVTIYDDEIDWSNPLKSFEFASAKEAMELMHSWIMGDFPNIEGGEQ